MYSSRTISDAGQGSVRFRESNAPHAALTAPGTIHALFEAQAQRTPDAIAAEYAGQRLTYRNLNERADRFASAAASQGVAHETIVGIGLQRSLELPIALFGVLKAGGVCMPLDPEYPPERLAYMLEDARVKVVVAEPEFANRYPSAHARVISPARELNGFTGANGQKPRSHTQPSDAAWIVYTSGSTGQPRGVVLTHAGLVNHHLAAIDLYGITARDRVLQFSSLSFDIAIEEMLPSWAAGATVVFREPETPLVASEFMAWIERKKISVLDLPTAYWHELVHGLAKKKQPLPESLRLVIVGGEKASASALETWTGISRGKVRWINTYGPSEASVIATSWEPRPEEELFDRDLPIGRPIANTRIYLLGPDLDPVEDGVTGELYIGGAGVARGYLNRPVQTAEKFIRDPFSAEPGAVLYRTGDMACYRPDGNIEFRGRTDHQVKMRGFRIELGEIETALERHPGVRESAATVVGDENKILAAWIVPSGAETPTARELRDFLASTLPDYMIPAVFHAVPAMPLTPNGKIDRRGLTRLENPIVRDREIIAPGDEIEARIVAILEKILQFRPIGIHDGFFELGGNSLLAIRLMGAIDEAFGRSFPLATLFQASTAAQIAAILRDPNEVAARGSLVVVQPLGAERPFFLVHGMGGHVLRFRALVRHFAPGQPVLALQAQGLSGEAPCLDRVEDMADRYLEEIRAVQRQGPYSLGGYSFGGFVALEIARRLEKLGEQVEYLALIDTFAGKPATKSSLLASLLRLSPLEQISYLSTKIRKKIRRMIAGVALPAPVKAVRQACADAERSYTPHVFKGKISLFLPSRKSLRNSPAEDGGWGELATAGVEVHEIPGDHGSIVDEPSAGELAKLILSGIDRSRLGQSKGEQARATEPGAANALSRPAVTELEKPATTLLGDTPAANGAIRPRSGEKAARWTAKGVFALTDQGLVSGSNFIISIVLARWLSPVEYGGFALVFAVFLLLSMAYQCLLLEPMAIYGVGEYGSRLRGYLKTLLVIHAVISGAILAILAASAEVAQLRGNAGGLPGALAGIGVAAPCILLFWLARRACYLNARSGVAAAGAVLYCASVMCGLWVAHSFVALSSFSAFLIMGVSGLLAAIVLFLLLNGSIVSTDPAPPARDAWRLHWGYGAWALGGAIASWIPAYIYYPLLGGFAGLGTVASLKALMNLAAPVMQLQAAFSMLLIPYAARRFRQGGAESVIGLGKLLTWGGLGCAVAYWLLIATFQHTIFHVLYAGRYAEVGALLPLAAIGSIFWAGTFGFSTALRAMERPRLIFIGFAIAAGVSLLAGIPATRMFGLTGAIWGINVSDLTAFLLLLIAVGRVRRTDDRDKLDWLSWPRNRTAAQPVNGTTK